MVRDLVAPDDATSEHQFGLMELFAAKLNEEFNEATDARTNDRMAEELADLLQVVYDLIKHQGFSVSHIKTIRMSKLKRCGGFQQLRVLRLPDVTVDIGSDDWLGDTFAQADRLLADTPLWAQPVITNVKREDEDLEAVIATFNEGGQIDDDCGCDSAADA